MPVEYFTMMKSKDDAFRFGIRRTMVLEAMDKGIKPTARAFRATVKTVRKWVKRYRDLGLRGLQEQSRAPHRIPHKTSPAAEAAVVAKKRSALRPIFHQLDVQLAKWAMRKYKRCHRRLLHTLRWLAQIARTRPILAHWEWRLNAV